MYPPIPWPDVPAVPPGNPVALAASVDRYAQTQALIERAAQDLLDAVFDGQGLAMAELVQTAGEAESGLIAAQVRYQGTTSALREYVVDLEHFHRTASAVIDREREAVRHYEWAESEADDAAAGLERALLDSEHRADFDIAQTGYRVASSRRDAALEAVQSARADYRRVEEDLDAAAQHAIARIVDSFDGTNDGFMDHLGRVISAAGQLLIDIDMWARDFLVAVLDAVVAAVELFLTAVVLAIALVALVVLLVAALALALVVLVAALAIIVGAVLWLLAAARAGTVMYNLTEALGIDGMAQIRLVLGAACAVCPPLAVALVSRVANEASKPAPTVTPLRDKDAKDPAAHKQLDSAAPTNAAEVLSWAGLVDQVGGDQRAVVDIAKVTQEDGSVAWIVTVPSTQDWVLMEDKPAPNDLDADLVLLAFPELQTQYERAVLDAMAQAGIPQDDPVLLSGWSLGGIGGGRLIEANAGGYDYEGLICAGSPIDHMAIPQDVNVLQVKHMSDVVHRTDLIDSVPDTERHLSVWDGSRSDGAAPLLANPIGVHANAAYVETLKANVVADDTASQLFADFYAIDDPATAAVPHVEHTQYAFAE